MKLKFYTVDTFTTELFHGNPTAVVPLDKSISEEIMQNIATEFRVSITAFIEPLEYDTDEPWINDSSFRVRWKTPTDEHYLCGHGILAVAHVLFNKLGNKSDVLTLNIEYGDVVAKRRPDDTIVFELPRCVSLPLSEVQEKVGFPLRNKLLGDMKIQEVIMSEFGYDMMIVRLDDHYTRKDLEDVKPVEMLSLHDGSVIHSIILTLKGELKDETSSRGLSDCHFASRYLSPWELNYPEDHVTGFSQSSLGTYWAQQLGITELTSRQCSARGGMAKLSLVSGDRIAISGPSIISMEGSISLP